MQGRPPVPLLQWGFAEHRHRNTHALHAYFCMRAHITIVSAPQAMHAHKHIQLTAQKHARTHRADPFPRTGRRHAVGATAAGQGFLGNRCSDMSLKAEGAGNPRSGVRTSTTVPAAQHAFGQGSVKRRAACWRLPLFGRGVQCISKGHGLHCTEPWTAWRNKQEVGRAVPQTKLLQQAVPFGLFSAALPLLAAGCDGRAPSVQHSSSRTGRTRARPPLLALAVPAAASCVDAAAGAVVAGRSSHLLPPAAARRVAIAFERLR